MPENTFRPYRISASFGRRQEFIAIGELLRRGYDVYQTLVDDQGIDCIIRKVIKDKPRYVDLQIKARSKECKRYDAARFAAFDIKDPRENFVFMFYSEWLNSYWIVPSLELISFASKNRKGNNMGRYHVLFSGMRASQPTRNLRFEQYCGESGFKKLEETFARVSY